MLELNAVNIAEFFSLMVVDNNCPNKSPEIVFKLGVISFCKSPDNLMVEFSFPLTTPAIGAIDFNISNCVNDSAIFTAFNPKFISNFGVFPLVETVPVKPIFPPKIPIFKLFNVTASSRIIIFPETSFKFKLS